MNIAIISNIRNLEHNYSPFIDSCDKILRINKMENVESGLSGNRTDILLVSVWYGYLWYSRKARKMDILKTVPEIYFNNEQIKAGTAFAEKEELQNWKFMPKEVHDSTWRFTTLGKGIRLMDFLYPDATLYYLGDMDSKVRTPRDQKHASVRNRENGYMESLIQEGRLAPILGNPLYFDNEQP